MKRLLKHILLFLLSPAISLVGDNYQNLGDIAINSPHYTFNTEIKVLFLKPSTSNLYFTAEAFPLNEAFATPGASPNWKTFDLHPKYHVAFDIGWRAIFHERASNLFFNWERFNSSTGSSVTASTKDMVGPFSSIGPDASPYKQVRGNVHLKFNEMNLRYGQYVDINNNLNVNIFAGISYAQLKQNLITFFSDEAITITRKITVPSSFKGAGPQAGFDLNYHIAKGFYFAGTFTAALLMGKTKNQTRYRSTSPELAKIGNPPVNPQSITQGSRTQMIPDFGQRLSFVYQDACKDFFTIELQAGWDSKILLNAIQSNDMASGVIDVTPFPNTVGVFARTFARTLGNFSLGGPYLGFCMGF